jgi:LPS export ABC transporter protein LptC
MRALILLLCLTFLASCANDAKVQPAVVPTVIPEEEPSQTSFDTKIRFTNEGLSRAILGAGRIRVYDKRRQTVLDSSVQVDFFDREGKHSSVLTAGWANINDQTKFMVAYDSVKIVSDSGTTVYTDSLTWNNETQRINSPANVKIVEKSGRVTTGRGFESDQSLTNYKILHTTIVAPGSTLQQQTGVPMIPRSNAPVTDAPSSPVLDIPTQVDTSR